MAEMNLPSEQSSNQANYRLILHCACFLGIFLEDSPSTFSRQPIRFCTTSLPI